MKLVSREIRSFLFNQEQIRFILENYKGVSTKVLAERLNKKFDTNFTYKQMQAFKSNNGLSSGYCARFKKGGVSANKGKTWDEYMPKESQKRSLKTAYKKGRESTNIRKLGSERITRDGYMEVKTEEPNVWVLKQRLIWEEYNGEIPDNHVIIFKDTNKQNLKIDNLEIISRAELLHLNRDGLISEDPELTEVGILFNKIRLRKSELIKNRR